MDEEYDVIEYDVGSTSLFEASPLDTADDVISARMSQNRTVQKSIYMIMFALSLVMTVMYLLSVVSFVGIISTGVILLTLSVVSVAYPSEDDIECNVISSDDIDTSEIEIQHYLTYDDISTPPEDVAIAIGSSYVKNSLRDKVSLLKR